LRRITEAATAAVVVVAIALLAPPFA